MFAVSPKREWRSTWFATVSNIDWPSKRGTTPEIVALQKQEMIDYLDGLAAMNMNAMCFQARPMSDAFYKSSYEPWSYYLTGERGKDLGWDPLAFVAEECHKRGMDCYVWINPYRWSSGKDWNTDFDKKLKENGILLKGSEKYTYLNPGLPEVREHIVNVCKDIITNYDIQGLIFDDYFYPSGIPSDETAGDYELWKEKGGDVSLSDWRRANVDLMIKNVYDMIQECRPDLRFGISPAGVAGRSAWKYGLPEAPFAKNDWQYERIFSDPLSWLNSGTLDFISPQEYFHTDDETKPFEPLTDWWDEMATHFGRHHYTSLSISCLNSDNSQSHWDEHVNQTLIARRLSRTGVFGLCYFSTRYLNGPAVSGAGQYFKDKLFSHLSLTPVLEWKKGVNYAPVSNLNVADGKLKWNTTSNGNAIIRYTVYVVPDSLSFGDVLTDDGLSNEYLRSVSYSTEYSIPTEYTDNYWYAVCVYDGYGRESRPAVVGYNGGMSQAVSLVKPANAEKVKWDCMFLWNSIEKAVYTLEIAEDKDFKNLVFSELVREESAKKVNLGILADNKEYYWRVVTLEEGKLETVSECQNFISPKRKEALKAELLSPKEGENVSTNIVFEWKGDTLADNYVLEITKSPDFSDVIHREETGENRVEIPSLVINIGTRYWRVISSGLCVNTSVSDCRSFVVNEVGVGDIEEGYQIKKDTYNYTDKNGMEVRNLWMRSVKEEFSNITFEDNGKLNRSFIAKDGWVYVVGRTENSSYASVYLRKYYGSTGEHVGDQYIYNSKSGSSYPCNTITKDNKGNVCIANMSTKIDSIPIYVNVVDVNTGYARSVCHLTCSEGGRADYIAVYGDVLSDCFYVFAAIKETNKVVRWTIEGDNVTEEVCRLKTFYPTNITQLGTAPQVIPITENDILVDGTPIPLSRYDFTTGVLTDSFAENKGLVPQKYSANGGTYFKFADKTYVAYSFNPYNNSTNQSNVQLVSINDQLDFSSMKAMWALPFAGLGSVSSGTMNVTADFDQIDSNTGVLYVYAPGNGLSAYEITDKSYSSVIDMNENDFSEEYYNLQGVRVKDVSSGLYIKRKGSSISKVIIKK